VNYPYNNIFNLPERLLLNKRITKVFFQKNFDLTGAEKKLLNNEILNIEWIACIKPTNANIPAIKTVENSYEEIQIILCTVSSNQLETNGKKCVELIQKYIPYHLVVIVEDDTEFKINTCDKRINQNDTSKRTIESHFTSPKIVKLYKNKISSSFFDSLDFKQLDKTNMETTYNGYTQAVIQFQAAKITGEYQKRNQIRTKVDIVNLLAIDNLEKDIVGLIGMLNKEKQLNTQVELNIEIQKKRTLINDIKNKIRTQ
jgi:hypothetical protein